MSQGSKNILRKIHDSSPLWLIRIYTPFVYFFRHLQTVYLCRYTMEGPERKSGTPIKVAYFGNDKKLKNYWESMLFAESANTIPGKKTLLWRARKLARKNLKHYDLMLVEINSLTRQLVKRKRGYFLPRWFDTLLDVNNSLDAISRNDTLKKIKMHGLSCEVRTSEDDLSFFYDRMFKPYITARHKDKAVLVDYNYFLKRFNKKDSHLFFLLKNNKPIAASFNEKEDGMMKFSGLGILDGSREIMRLGAVRALYYFMLNYYKETNVRRINFGGASPLLSDGLTQFKVALRAFPNKKKLLGEKSIWVTPLNDSSASRNFLTANPFIYIKNKKVLRALFVDSSKMEKKKELVKLLKTTRYRELSGTEIYCWNGTEKISNWIREEGFEDFKVKDYCLNT